ncbi:T9SS type A sorting domain-containing protein [Polaribacter haliotis]|uniref:T9SS type A sorting domain-containing protein n=1 Tax=Polaribacter haliotis TaxID=1888915 RepID=A0A7L8AIE1_9FLAO|nr:choice-of-anchor V domain-containing protein [Polaribacter haliotis]QOD61771.1 T9SS type A sorting domain-containing protein [Polaribacter haliotis]
MKKNYIFKIFLLSIPFIALVLMSNAGGKVNATSTGSPGDGGSCISCHNGGNFGASAAISTNIPATGYDTNTAYTITVTANSSAPAHGFQLTAEKESNNSKIGTFTPGSTTRTINAGNTSITHNSPNNKSWTFTWNSPATDEGQIKFYAAVNAANGNGSAFDSSDQTVLTSTNTINVLGIPEAKRLNFEMFPNPSSTMLNIQLPAENFNGKVEFFDVVGRMILSKKITSKDKNVDVTNLNKGIYTLKITSDNKVGSKQFIKN